MDQGKYLSLEEARKLGKLEEFEREHLEKSPPGAFDVLLQAMASGALLHASDCAMHDAPAYKAGPCTCGVTRGVK